MNFKKAKKLTLLFLTSLTSTSFAAKEAKIGKAAVDLLSSVLSKTDLVQTYKSMKAMMNEPARRSSAPVGQFASKVPVQDREEKEFESLLSRYLTGTSQLREDVNALLKAQRSLSPVARDKLLARFEKMNEEERTRYMESLKTDYTTVGERVVVSRVGDKDTGRVVQQHDVVDAGINTGVHENGGDAVHVDFGA